MSAATVPDEATFKNLAGHYSVVPVRRERLGDTLTPVMAFLRVVGEASGFLFESAEGGERWGRFSFVGRRPLATLIAAEGGVSISGPMGAPERHAEGMLAAIESLLGSLKSPNLEGLPPLHGGIVGYLGYDVVREVENLGPPPPDDRGIPTSVVSVIGQLVAFDHWRQSVTVIDNVLIDPSWGDEELSRAWDGANARLDELEADLFSGGGSFDAGVVSLPSLDELPESRPTMGDGQYKRAVEIAKERILDGDIFQVVLSQRFDVDLRADPFDCYRVLRHVNPSPYMYFLRYPEVSIVGSSPEPMVRVERGRVISRPIAGTRRRGQTKQEDAALAAQLAEDPKERAEHVMLVDLARNDVGRVCRFGTESVDELMILERYSHVMHLTSEVSGELVDGLGPVDVLRATLPAGTVSGAPKVSAMQIIDELEPTMRGPYAGVVGYLDFSGNVDVAITIRTMFVDSNGMASVQAGAGIVADSDPAAEDEECANKAAAVLATIPPARAMAKARAAGVEGGERG